MKAIRLLPQPCVAPVDLADGLLGDLSPVDASQSHILQHSKKILPRLERMIHYAPAGGKRTAHACERCRTLKAKCTGGPTCGKCLTDKVECKFGDGKRERNKKEMASQLRRSTSLSQQNGQLLAALREVSDDPDFDPSRHPAVMQLLFEHPPEEGLSKSDLPPREDRCGDFASMVVDRNDASAAVNSSGAIDSLTSPMGFGHGSGEEAFIGRSSEISWLQHAQDQKSSSPTEMEGLDFPSHENKPAGTLLDYHMDEANILSVNEESIDPTKVPSPQVASQLTASYFETVHGSFPLVDRKEFMSTLFQYRRSLSPISREDRHWLSVANVIFAIGAKWMYLTRSRTADTLGPHIGRGDHVIYYARARALGLDHRLLMDHPVIEQIQGSGVLGLYLIVNHQIPRAWTTIGHAMRHAVALGLHLRAAKNVDINKAAACARTWWSIYALEQLLGDLTGRPTSILLDEIAAPLELFETTSQQEPPWTDQDLDAPALSAFAARVRLSIFAHRIRTPLDSCDQVKNAWSGVQQKIWTLDQQLTQWFEALPAHLTLSGPIDVTSSNQRSGQYLNQLELAMFYQSTRMMLFRPCLCHLEGTIPHESSLSQKFDREAAISCITAACNLLDLLPNDAASSHTSTILPWWSILHYLNQAGAVLFLELCLKAEHMPARTDELFKRVRKVMAWLGEMATDLLSAHCSLNIFRKLLMQAAASLEVDMLQPEDAQQLLGEDSVDGGESSFSVEAHGHERLQMPNQARQQARMPAGTASELFSIGVEILNDPWLLLPPSRAHSSDQSMTYTGRQAYHPVNQSTGWDGSEATRNGRIASTR